MSTSVSSTNLLRIACIGAIVLFPLRALTCWVGDGMFYSLGVDYALYGASAEVAARSGWPSIYNPDAITRSFAGWLAGGLDRSDPATLAAHVYHAPFLFPFFATNLLGHLGGFAAWTILNLLLYAAIVQEAGAGEGETDTDRRDPIVRLAPFAFLPFLFGLYLGQVVIVMAFGLHRALRAFTEGREWAAGCWLGVLLAKPQLGLIFVPVLLARRRWRALGALMFVGAALAAATLVLVGADGIRGYLATARAFSGFRQVPRLVYPWDMISIRGVLVQLLPASVDEAQGLRAVHLLSAAMLLALIPIWRGSWNPREPRFARQMLATMIVALLAGFHTHVHAAVLLVPPLLIALREGQGSDPLRTLAALLFLVPTFSVALNSNLVQGAWLIIILMAGMLGSILAGLARGERPNESIVLVEPPAAAISSGGLAR